MIVIQVHTSPNNTNKYINIFRMNKKVITKAYASKNTAQLRLRKKQIIICIIINI